MYDECEGIRMCRSPQGVEVMVLTDIEPQGVYHPRSYCYAYTTPQGRDRNRDGTEPTRAQKRFRLFEQNMMRVKYMAPLYEIVIDGLVIADADSLKS